MQKISIAIDAMGGDFAPAEIVKGAFECAQENPEVEHILVGIEFEVKKCLDGLGKQLPNVRTIHAPEVVTMEDKGAMSLRSKPNSSIAISLKLVKSGAAQAVVSAGNTAAMAAGAYYILGLLEGVKRPGIAVLIPTQKGQCVLIDAGATVNARPVNLLQFAIMGQCFMAATQGVASPKIGLLNIGEEHSKGNDVVRETYELFKRCELNFENVEGNRVHEGKWDVIACDGFIGNVLLKAGEGLAEFIFGNIKRLAVEAKIDPSFMKPAFKVFDYAEIGGAPLLGVKGIVVISHGRSRAHAIASAIRNGIAMARQNLAEKIAMEISKISVWKRLSSWLAAKFSEDQHGGLK